MTRPLSIQRYERLYLLALALGVGSTMLDWPQRAASFARDPILAEMGWMLPASLVVNVLLRLTLWFYTARRANRAAKWFVVLLAGIALVLLLFSLTALIAGATPSLAASLTGIISGALYIAATAYLFRGDARAWFGEEVHGEGELEL
ncbi:hypothetical protein [Sphingomonas jeddahensis]|uniref:Uncharacterized protein n=1 Tax=Sphingomonas jeddahensis TaxID=1915074 RepID=A0A1V2EY51_9SPHN|nr:hypothetical protein [Sphingomonas jeddahensis]ONF97443.1 hypothetical protein SPHI_00730 [Sphingomonas jeddahensis]